MSRGKNNTPNQRVMVKHINKFGMLENAPYAPSKRSTTERIDGIIRRLSEDNRRLTARDIHNEMKPYPECSLSVRSIRRRLVEAALNRRVARKKPVSLKNKRTHATFA
uniref:HTH_Tnp_Tc3_2 domain-containing protein n=1 Tax=Heterorhabditis bacteriophora TaxID=37862 RepID=A0A1I7XR74_HETBA